MKATGVITDQIGAACAGAIFGVGVNACIVAAAVELASAALHAAVAPAVIVGQFVQQLPACLGLGVVGGLVCVNRRALHGSLRRRVSPEA